MKINFLTILIIGFLLSCTSQKKNFDTIKMISAPATTETSCPYLTYDIQRNIVLSWVEKSVDNSTKMWYSVSTNQGQTFDSRFEITSSDGVYPHAENLPKIIWKPNGDIIAVWGESNPNQRNKYSGAIYYAQSFDEGKSWTPATPLVSDTKGIDQRYFDITILPNNEVGIIWLDNRSESGEKGMTPYFSETNERNGFLPGKPISKKSCECCRTVIFTDKNRTIHLAYRDIIDGKIRDMVHSSSTDNGETFSTPMRISEDNWEIMACPHSGPAMLATDFGLHAAWFTGAGNQPGVYYSFSVDNGKSFRPRQLLSSAGNHPQMTRFANQSVGIVWQEAVETETGFFSKIVLNIIQKNSLAQTLDVTDELVQASFPVILSTENQHSVIAWVQEEQAPNEHEMHQNKGKTGSRIFYKRI